MLVATQKQQLHFNGSTLNLWEELEDSGCRKSIHLDMPCQSQTWHLYQLKKLQEIWAEAGEVLTFRKRSLGRKNQQPLDPIPGETCRGAWARWETLVPRRGTKRVLPGCHRSDVSRRAGVHHCQTSERREHHNSRGWSEHDVADTVMRPSYRDGQIPLPRCGCQFKRREAAHVNEST